MPYCVKERRLITFASLLVSLLALQYVSVHTKHALKACYDGVKVEFFPTRNMPRRTIHEVSVEGAQRRKPDNRVVRIFFHSLEERMLINFY